MLTLEYMGKLTKKRGEQAGDSMRDTGFNT